MSHPSTGDQTLFARVGGEEGVKRLVKVFYDHVLSDPELKPFFEAASMSRLRQMQYEFFSAALNGPVQYSGITLSHAHQGRGISSRHLARFVEHLVATLKEHNISEREVYDIIARINTYSDEVTGSPAMDG